MDYMLLFVVALQFAFIPQSQAVINSTIAMNLITWENTVREVNKTNSLAQVLREYLDDIGTVEAAASQCAASHRDTYSRVEGVLRSEVTLCVANSGHQKSVLARCVEDKTRRTVSDVRQQITQLKHCLDGS